MSNIKLVFDAVENKYKSVDIKIDYALLDELSSQYFDQNSEKTKTLFDLIVYCLKILSSKGVTDFVNASYFERTKHEAAEVCNSASFPPVAYAKSSIVYLLFGDEVYALHMTIQFCLYQLVLEGCDVKNIYSSLIVYVQTNNINLKGQENDNKH